MRFETGTKKIWVGSSPNSKTKKKSVGARFEIKTKRILRFVIQCCIPPTYIIHVIKKNYNPPGFHRLGPYCGQSGHNSLNRHGHPTCGALKTRSCSGLDSWIGPLVDPTCGPKFCGPDLFTRLVGPTCGPKFCGPDSFTTLVHLTRGPNLWTLKTMSCSGLDSWMVHAWELFDSWIIPV